MALLLDTGILYAYYDRSDSWHKRTVELLRSEEGQLVLPAPVVPEADFLIGKRLGAKARRTLLRGIADGFYFVADLPRDLYARTLEIDERFSDLDLGFVDSSLVAIGESLGLLRIATTDRRHFEPLAAPFGLTLLP